MDAVNRKSLLCNARTGRAAHISNDVVDFLDENWVITERYAVEMDRAAPVIHHNHPRWATNEDSGLDEFVNLLYPVVQNLEGDLFWCSKCEAHVPEEVEVAYNLMIIGDHDD